ncbi:hypothetical protein HHK36_015097 [Tetracentron sinense]|uniref:DNA topoisomerase n=1 Tax=Tetracentron sinense TaxID=13715 RepID=A0A834ZAD3_TETSI|nr:hypothetical protein HHK36_015097 [Tetracentron sinense]
MELVLQLQYRAVQNCTVFLPYSPLGNGKECGKCVRLKFKKSRERCMVATDQSKALKFKVERDFFISRSLTDGYGHGGAFTTQSHLGAGFPFTLKFGNIFTYRCLDSGIRLNLPYYACRDRRSFSVKAIQKSQVPRTSINKNENLAAKDGNSRGKYFSFKKFNAYRKRAKSLAACSSSFDGGVQVAVSNQPVKESAHNTRKSVVRTVDVVNSQERVGGDCKKDVEPGPHVSTLAESSNNNQDPKVKVRKKQKTRSKKHEEQLAGISSPSSAAQAKSSKRVSQVKRSSLIKADQSSQASENLSAGETPMTVVDHSASVHHELKKRTGNSTRSRKPQKKVTVLMESEKTIPKPGKSAPLVSSSSELQLAQKFHVESQKKPLGKRPLRQLYPPIGKSVVVVESATKSKVIQGYLGDMFEVLPSYGHVRDLASRSGSVRPDDDFSMVWEVPSAAWTHLKSIKVALKGAENLILASDPDREGEAIAWHILEMLQQQDALNKNITVSRVVFHEITESSIKRALQAPRDIDANLVHAYLARRALDYLIGFNISPLLWRKLPGCQSAGRVQSAALSLICDREMEINDFKPQEYWSVEVELKKDNSLDKAGFPFLSFLTHFDSKKLEQLSISSHAEAKVIEQKISSSKFKVIGSKRSKTRKNPPAPFITSTLQQDAANKLHFSATYTMKVNDISFYPFFFLHLSLQFLHSLLFYMWAKFWLES